MKAISREDYIGRLGKLSIENPTPEDMALVCPHLTQEQAVAAFEPKGDNLSSYVACPPVRIRGAFQIVNFTKKFTASDGKICPPHLSWAFASRTRESYKDKRSHGDIFHPYKWMEEAISYAEEHWGDELVLDNWASHIAIYVQDPSDLTERETPKTKAVVYFTTDREWNDIIDRSKPKSEVINDNIVIATLNRLEGNELKGGRGSYTHFNCAYCSAGLGGSGCTECGHRFRDDHFRSGWYTPLPKKLVDLLEQSGHIFKRDPAIAQQRELNRWTADNSKS